MKKPAASAAGFLRERVCSAAAGAFALSFVAAAGAFALGVCRVATAVSVGGVIIGATGAFSRVGGRHGGVGDFGRRLLFVAARKEESSGTEDSESGRDVFELHGGGMMHAAHGIVHRDGR